ncbi:putative PIF1 helicase-like protein [Leptomonas pyrrhocoris]|uniref:ATP-dependent DNA helicase n=1 Tax=Leptomonas pyrrhocoris TaxID=157538 RepID=A0A0M9FY33_LEPPY|nr:putative PIF1 helicase-like protein [Leptomonas pyrrhocoris]KPA78297.1 putative PIF1 helicase-like protein [Leptomonas pyrrhocoris]|eukprot:XP_015656736.1 putative PIF1 helicase-like protein [Leptomonas pyrrhocoris]
MAAMAVRVRVPKPKTTVSAVRGRVLVFAEDGERIGQWGGSECFLSRQNGLGPCLVVRSSRHKRHEGTFFQLARLQRVLSTHVAQGRLTVVVPHERRLCSVYVETTDDVDELRMMAGVLQDKSRWKDMERNVASKSQRGPRSGGGGALEVSSGGGVSGGGGSGRDSAVGLRDPLRASLSGRGAGEEDEESEKDSDADSVDDAYGARYGAEVRAHGYKMVAAAAPEGEKEPSQPVITGGSTTTGTAAEKASPVRSGAAASASPLVTSTSASASATQDFTPEQRRAVQLLRSGHNVFITGAAGTGKTEWLRCVLRHVLASKEHGHDAVSDGEERVSSDTDDDVGRSRVAVTAATAAAARRIGGTTVHLFAGIGRGEGDPAVVLHRMQNRPDVVRAWQQCEVLVIDAIHLLPAHTFALLDRLARVLRAPLSEKKSPSPAVMVADNAALPFGGLQLVVVGDFLQLPPPSSGAGEEAQPAFACTAWQACQLEAVVFTKDHRHAADEAFARCCDDVRRGACTPLVQAVLTPCVNRRLESRGGVEATTVMAHRADADRYNAQRLQQLDSVAFQRYASEDYAAEPGADIDSELPLPAVVTLKEGAQVVLLAALPGAPQLSGGDVGIVVGFAPQAHGPAPPKVRFTTGMEAVVVPAVTMSVRDREGRLTLRRRQLPLQLAWALSVYHVEGLTLPMVRLALDASLGTAAETYVALSRVRRAADVSLTAFDAAVIGRVSGAAREFHDGLLPSTKDAASVGLSPASSATVEASDRARERDVVAVDAAAGEAGGRRRPRSGSPDDDEGRLGARKTEDPSWSAATRMEMPL